MKIAIQPDKSKLESYSDKWAEYLQKKGVAVKFVDVTKSSIFEDIKDCDGLMWRFFHSPDQKQIAKRILLSIEKHTDKVVFPNADTCWHYDDKIAQYYIFKTLNIPFPKTWIFWDKDEAIRWAKTADFPKVFKLTCGASSKNVRIVNSKSEAIHLIERMFKEGIFQLDVQNRKNTFLSKNKNFLKANYKRMKSAVKLIFFNEYPYYSKGWQWQVEKNYVYFQEFIKNNDFDTRIIVVGDRAFGCIRKNREGDFRASGSGLIDFNRKKISPAVVKMAFDISKKLKSQSLAFDFLVRDNEYIITEISYTFPQYEPWRQFPGFWTKDLKWVNKPIWPEEAQVEDFVHIIQQKKNENQVLV